MEKINNKMTEFIKRYDNIFVLIIILLSIFGVTLNILIISSDEIWNFQSVNKMYNGNIIYRDVNVIITPLFFIIGKILFNLLGANLLTFRIYNIIIMSIFYFLTYILLKELGIRKKISLIIILILIIFKNNLLIITQANYNTMALMFCILGVYLYIKKYKFNNIIQGIIIFLIFCTKQNIGIYYGIGLIFYEIINKNKKIKNLIIEFFIFSILLILLLIIFNINGILFDFINYTILGIKEFSKENIVIKISYFILSIFFIFYNLIITIIFLKNKKINKIEKDQLLIMTCFSTPMILTSWPIVNDIHTLIGIYLSIILHCYIIKIMTKEINIKINEKILNFIFIILCIITIGFSIFNFINWKISKDYFNREYKIQNGHPFYGGIFEIGTLQKINSITEYIDNNSNTVIVLSSQAALYMVPLQRNNGIMDLPFKGNLGLEGENKIIEKIKNKNNLEILIVKNEEDIMWQESKLVRKFILENMKKIGEIEDFYIYQNIK